MAASYLRLFSPIALGSLELKNRLFNPPHGTSLGSRGCVGDDLVAYHEARAKGGVGLIILEGMALHETHEFQSGYLLATRDEIIPGLRRLKQACARHGTPVIGQLFHAGRAIRTSHDGSKPRVFSASDEPDDRYRVVAMPMSASLIADVVAGYASAARRLDEAGLDGVEILASMGYLVCQFLNPTTNTRTDAYGGTFDNRLRFLREVLAAVRAEIGRDKVLGIRVSGNEMTEGGLDLATMVEVCKAIERDGLIDYVSVIAGSSASPGGWIHVFPPMAIPHGYVAPQAAAMKAVLKCPVMVAGRINQPQLAEEVLANGEADMVGMVRALISDPELPNKARTGRSDDIRACVGCNQACVGHRLSLFGVSCIQNPVTGREVRYGSLPPAAKPRNLLVIGGGPAGMKAAVTAAARGHRVALIEKERQLGGQVRFAEKLPGRAEFGGVSTNLKREIELSQVNVETGVAATAELIEKRRPDAVILATGARPRGIPNETTEGAHVVQAWAVISGEANVGGRVVIADWACDWVGLGVAEMLARRGCHVRLVSGGIVAGEAIQPIVRDHWIGELHRLGVELIPYAKFYGGDRTTAYFQHMTSGEPIVCEETETIVLNGALRSDRSLEAALAGFTGELRVVGDAAQPRTVEEAILEGFEAGHTL
ncbi:MAG: FAD-dependent oxidoreductase [Hyphomicrobiaceae bacterium]